MKGDICKALAMDESAKPSSWSASTRTSSARTISTSRSRPPELDEQVARNRDLVKLSKATGAPLVATKDVHYLRPDDAEAHDILLCDGEARPWTRTTVRA